MKWILGGLGLVIAAILGISIYVYINLGSLIKTGIETYAPPILDVPVSVDSVSLMPLSGSGDISGFTVANPKGYSEGTAIGLGKANVDIDTKSLAEDTIVINHIVVDAPTINFIQLDSTRNNFSQLIDNITKNSSSSATPENDTSTDTAPTAENTTEKKLIIDKLLISNIHIAASSPLLPNETIKVPVPDIKLEALGRSTNGAAPAELAKQIASQLTQQMKAALLNSDIYKQQIKAKIDQRLAEEKQKAKQRLEQEKADLKEKAQKKLDEKLGDKKELLKSLFK